MNDKIYQTLNELQEAEKVSKAYLPKVKVPHSCYDSQNPVLYDYQVYRLNAWEDDKVCISKYKDFMKQPI